MTETVWNSPLSRPIGLLRRSGQHFCADQCQELYDLLHEWDPSTRLETSIVRKLILQAARASSTESPTMASAESYVGHDDQLDPDIPGLEDITWDQVIRARDSMIKSGQLKLYETPFGTLKVIKHSLLTESKIDSPTPDDTAC